MRLTLIMPLYNREQYIEMALLSVLRQSTDCDLDLLVVNDGSTDRSAELVENLAGRYPQLRMVTTPNQGVAGARNIGLANLPVDCEFVTFLDSDDVSPPTRLRDDLAVFRQHPDVEFTYGRMTLVDQLDAETYEPTKDSHQITVRGISLSAGIFRAELVRETGEFDESFEQAEDADFLFRTMESGRRHELTNTICCYYRQHIGNMTSNKAALRKSIMRAVHKSVLRRRRNPALQIPTNFFDLREYAEAGGVSHATLFRSHSCV